MTFVVAINRPYYPEVHFIESEKEAEEKYAELIRENDTRLESGRQGEHEAQVVFGSVIWRYEMPVDY